MPSTVKPLAIIRRVVLRDHQVFEHRHALEQADVLERAGDLGAPGDFIAGHAFEQIDLAGRRLRVPLRASG